MNIDLWKKRKKELHLTHDQLAEISGVSRRTIAGIFANDPARCSPTYNTVQAIEKALGIDGGITPEEYAAGARYTKRADITADEEDILDKAKEVTDALGEKGKDLIINFCDMLLKSLNK